MPEPSREELEAENARLRAALARAGVDAGRTLAGTTAAGEETPQARGDAALNAALRRANGALAASEDHLRAVLASAIDYAIIATDLQGRVTGWNEGACRVLGWAESEVLWRDVRVIWTPEDREAGAPDAEMRDALVTGAAADERWHMRRDGTRFWSQGQLTPLRDGGGDGAPRGFLKILRDRTEQRAAEQALRELNETLEARVGERTTELMRAEEALRQSQKMEAVGQLTGGLAHDFNNLLTGIIGSLELLQARVREGRTGDMDRYVVAAHGAAKRAAALTHRLLAFSRRQTLDPKPVNASRLVSGMEEMIQRTVGPAITVETVAAGGLWTTLCDPHQLENALLNLCINARDAMPDGGRLTIETGNKWLDARVARERDLLPGQYVTVCVSDTGAGMTPDVLARAFDPFYTTKPIGQGTGLGLSMVYGFARQSGGQARIYSEPGHGATVCVYLPRHHAGEAGTADTGAELAAVSRVDAGHGRTVLVVDDEPTVRMLVAEVLDDLGCTAIEAADGAAGLRVLQSDARINLLITDVGLPGGINGRQVAEAGRAARPGLKVLFITGYAENAVLSHGHLQPGMQVLTKPFAMDALAARVRDLVAGG